MNVTPLVDVVLVLLIIFMVVAPQLQQDVPVNLPGIFNPDPDVEGNMDPLKITLATAGEYRVEDHKYDLNGITQYLIDQHAADPYRRLVLRADQGLKYGQVREFLARAQQVGFPGLNFMVGEKHRAGAGVIEYELAPEPAAPDQAQPGQAAPEQAPSGQAAAEPAPSEPAPEQAPEQTPPSTDGTGS
jgi:biopolymer transport protein TolR